MSLFQVDEINEVLLYILKKNEVYTADLENFKPIIEPYGRSGEKKLLEQLEELLPTLEDDEEAHKGMWDTLVNIHGQEAVRQNKDINEDWDARCLVVRLLIVYNFIHNGV